MKDTSQKKRSTRSEYLISYSKKISFKKLDDHLSKNTRQHLHLVAGHTNQLQKEIRNLKNQVNKLKSEFENPKSFK